MQFTRVSRLVSLAALLGAPVLAHAVPVQYSFNLRLTELSTNPNKPIDPYYSQFSLGQTFHGTLTYDAAAATPGGSLGYRNAVQYSVQIGDALIGSTGGDFTPSWPQISLTDGSPDRAFIFDEVPEVMAGSFGSEGGYIEQFYFDFGDSTGNALTGNVPGPIDFLSFDTTRWNFWWQSEGAQDYSRLLMYGTIDDLREVPEPMTAALMLTGLAGLFGARRWKGSRRTAEC